MGDKGTAAVIPLYFISFARAPLTRSFFSFLLLVGNDERDRKRKTRRETHEETRRQGDKRGSSGCRLIRPNITIEYRFSPDKE